ncbi:hypothetical protein UY3_06500 [Chelonia mydas]|uniref:Uncharacterized protein n=1 Tax=Chelonia mydas TaxID=8469 RepID=M7C711_CHEMY|nr:hypothetical protein UY3_06500 [Chelonia mydas]
MVEESLNAASNASISYMMTLNTRSTAADQTLAARALCSPLGMGQSDRPSSALPPLHPFPPPPLSLPCPLSSPSRPEPPAHHETADWERETLIGGAAVLPDITSRTFNLKEHFRKINSKSTFYEDCDY